MTTAQRIPASPQPSAGQAQSSGPAAATGATAQPVSIRDSIMTRLREERGEGEPSRRTAPERQPAQPEPGQPDTDEQLLDAGPEQDPLTDESADEAGEYADADLDDADPDELPQVAELREQVAKLEKANKELRADYSRKTAKLAESGRALEQDSMTVRQTAQFVAGLIDAPIRQFEQIPWQQLQTADPARYQALRDQYQQAMSTRNSVFETLANIEQAHEAALKQDKERQAAIARDILSTEIDGWGRERFEKLHEVATAAGYTTEEFAEVVDHRFMRLLNELYTLRSATQKLTGTRREATPQRKPQQHGANREVIRDTTGKFRNAQQMLQQNPGDRNARRGYFAAKLAAERKGKGR
jgi:hypothetical protein